MSLVIRNPDFCICENKGADQLNGNLCFRYMDSTIPLLPNFKALAIFYDCTAGIVSDQVINRKKPV